MRSWKQLAGDDFVVIGGYESGMDAASNLAACGKRCTVVSSTAFWRVQTEDPSTELAPYTAERVRAACATPTPPRLLAPLRVFAVERRVEADPNPNPSPNPSPNPNRNRNPNPNPNPNTNPNPSPSPNQARGGRRRRVRRARAMGAAGGACWRRV